MRRVGHIPLLTNINKLTQSPARLARAAHEPVYKRGGAGGLAEPLLTRPKRTSCARRGGIPTDRLIG
jgi:hypothetical protein